MTLDKAIEILTLSAKGVNLVSHKDLMESVKLGIEALKRIKSHRHHTIQVDFRPLLGETKT